MLKEQKEEILLDRNPSQIKMPRANAYDMVINGVEVGGGSVRIYNKQLQAKMFELLGFTDEEAQHQFGFLMDAFQYGAPPHAGIAFGFDRLCSLFGGADSIRDFIAFPKNNSGRDVMIDAPSNIDEKQLKDLSVAVVKEFTELNAVQLKTISNYKYYYLINKPELGGYIVYFSYTQNHGEMSLTLDILLGDFCNSTNTKYFVNLKNLERIL
jgi:hypothetical protein